MSVKTMVANIRDDARRVLREEKVKITGGIGTQPRGITFRLADRRRQDPGSCRSCSSSSRPGGRGFSAAANRRPTRSTRARRARSGSASPTPASPTRSVARWSSRSRSSAARVDATRHDGAVDPARGQRQHPRRGAGPAGSRGAEEDRRHHRQADLPARCPAERQCAGHRDAAAPGGPEPDGPGREAGDGAGRGPDQGLDRHQPAERRGGGQLHLQHSRRREVRPGHVAACRRQVRDRARRQGDLRPGASTRRSPVDPGEISGSRSPCRAPTSWPCCCAPARCRRS